MSKLLKALFHFYMLSAVDGDGGGGGAVDRGDDVPEGNTEVADEPAVETPEEAEKEAEKEIEEPARDEKGRFIPKERFDEAVGKEREARAAAEQRLAALEKELQSRQQTQKQGADVEAFEAHITTLEDKHTTLLLDGDAKGAAAVMKEIRMAERQIAKLEMQQDSTAITAHAIEAERVEYAIASLEADHPVFNPDSEEFDEELVNFALAEQQRLMKAEGMAPSRALVKAATTIMKRFAAKPAEVDAKPGLAKAAQDDRKAAQVAKNLETQKRQPASMRDSGIDSDKAGQQGANIDPSRLSYEEFEALPDSVKAKLRGDNI
jgi:hypothetical protein